MRLHFHAEQWLPYPLERVFAFFADPSNLPRLMPGWQRARIDEEILVTPPAPPPHEHRAAIVAAGTGTRLTLSFRPFPYSPVRLSWLARIEDFRWDQGFCDVQLRGPFHYWRHCHSVEAAHSPLDGTHGTRLRDEVNYELPLGTAGAVAGGLIARWQLSAAFRFRHRRTTELLAQRWGPRRSQSISRFN